MNIIFIGLCVGFLISFIQRSKIGTLSYTASFQKSSEFIWDLSEDVGSPIPPWSKLYTKLSGEHLICSAQEGGEAELHLYVPPQIKEEWIVKTKESQPNEPQIVTSNIGIESEKPFSISRITFSRALYA